MEMDVQPIDGAPRQLDPPPQASSGEGQQVEKPEVDPARKARVAAWCERIKTARKRWEKRFERMRKNQKLARQGAPDAWKDGQNYTVPIAARHINQKVARLYARNPQARAAVKPRLMYQLWNEHGASLQQMQQMQAQGMLPSPEDIAVLMEIQQVKMKLEMLEKVGRTLEYLWNYYVSEQTPSFKQRFKQMVRRTCTNCVGYVELGFQRIMEPRPEVSARLEDITSVLSFMETLASDMQQGKFGAEDARADELKTMMADLQAQTDVVVREGLVFDFPRSTEIIVDPKVREMKGFVGAEFIVREFHMNPSEIKEAWKVDVGSEFTAYDGGKQRSGDSKKDDTTQACVWYVQHKKAGECFVVVDGYCDFVTEPAPPAVQVEGFWTTYCLAFNDVEDEEDPFPPSDMEFMEDAQDEYNRARQALREHRIAARPGHVVPRGGLQEEDKRNLQNRKAHDVIELNGVQLGQDVKTVLQAIPTAPIDPNLYEVGPQKEDILMSTGSQEANFGPTSDATATESSIAENSRDTVATSDVDEIDELLTQLARDGAQVLLLNMSPEIVKKIAGPGAVWPELSRQDIVEEITLEIKAGSSGRPNAAAELAKMERGMPFLLQIPGVNPTPLAEIYSDLLGIDWKKLIVEGLPSIQAMNALITKQVGAAAGPAPDNAPQNQGGEGGANAEQPPGQAPQGQPAYPADGAGPGVPNNALQAM